MLTEFDIRAFRLGGGSNPLNAENYRQFLELCDLALIGLKSSTKTERVVKVPADYKKDPAFMQFYNAYPRHDAPGDAYKAWKQVKPDLQLILEALSWQRREPGWNKERCFIPLPATYLRGRQFENERPRSAWVESEAKPKHIHIYETLLDERFEFGHDELRECQCGDRQWIPKEAQ